MSKNGVDSPPPSPGAEEGRPKRSGSRAWADDNEASQDGEANTPATNNNTQNQAAKDDQKEKEERPKTPPKPKFPRRLPNDPKRVSFLEDQPGEEVEDQPEHHDPQFYLGAATVIGMMCFCTFIFNFINDYSETSSLLIWLVTGIGGFITFLIPFFYYLVTSQHPFRCCGRLFDGLVGGIPFLPVGCGVFYIYVVLALACKNVSRSRQVFDKIMVFTCVPIYLILWVPLFLYLLRIQNTELGSKKEGADDVEAGNGGTAPTGRSKPDYGKSPWKVSVVVFRRLIIAGVVSCCGTSYAILPLFGFAWACYGMYLLWEIHPAIPMSILGVLIILIVILAICCPKVLKAIGSFFVMFYTLPLTGWGPRPGNQLLPRYDNSLTLDRRVTAHNAKIDRMEDLREEGKAEEAEALAEEARRDRQVLVDKGANLIDEIIVIMPPEETEEEKKKKKEAAGASAAGGPGGQKATGNRKGRHDDNSANMVSDVESI